MNRSGPLPPGLLLATDLDCRCDRALERAALLARAGGVTPAAATVVEPAQRLAQRVPMHELPDWYRAPVPLARAERRLRRDLEASSLRWRRYADEGEAGACLLRVLEQEAAEARGAGVMVVTGPVREGLLGPAVLGSTVDRLLRRPGTPLLMVRQRPHGAYRHLLVASDLSAPAAAALRAAHALFPQARITLLHGFEVPMLGLRDTTRESAATQARARLRTQALAWLRECGLAHDRVELVLERADPARLMQQYADTFEPDLAVVGTHGHGAVRDTVVGSVARRIIGTSTLDTLVVHP